MRTLNIYSSMRKPMHGARQWGLRVILHTILASGVLILYFLVLAFRLRSYWHEIFSGGRVPLLSSLDLKVVILIKTWKVGTCRSSLCKDFLMTSWSSKLSRSSKLYPVNFLYHYTKCIHLHTSTCRTRAQRDRPPASLLLIYTKGYRQ